MAQKTPLYQKHLSAGAKIVDFAGWDMPLHYGSQLEEHQQVRKNVGVFDVSHMTVVDVTGPQAQDFLRYLLANDVGKLKKVGKALYSCMLNESGGVVDDLIVYFLGEQRYRLVVNSGTRTKDLQWLEKHRKAFLVTLTPRPDLCILAIQGPNTLAKMAAILPAAVAASLQNLRPFEAIETADFCIGRTGYTGEDGLEIMLPEQQAPVFWDTLMAAGIAPCGLGARDTLRLEAGLNLYGADMDETTSPLESNLAWTVALDPPDRQFIGRKAIENQQSQVQRTLVGLVLTQKGVLRNHQKVILPGVGEGEITSGSFSPTLQQAIAFARIPVTTDRQCFVDIRGQQVPAHIVKTPFVRHGKQVYTL